MVSPVKWNASGTGADFILNSCFAAGFSSNSSSNWCSSALKRERNEGFAVVYVTEKVVTVVLKWFEKLKSGCDHVQLSLSWASNLPGWHSTSKSITQLPKPRGPAAVKCPAGFSSSHSSPRQIIWINLSWPSTVFSAGILSRTSPSVLRESFNLSCGLRACWTAAIWP